MRWDIFCTVVDNYGDAGVCWRLARQLAREHNLQVRLIIDHIPTLEALVGQRIELGMQYEGVTVIHWDAVTHNPTIAEVVIEAFACELPSAYLVGMKATPKTARPLWLNLEYLSAEAWVDGCHGLVSKHPQFGLEKTFFFPGFTERTGGLIREAKLIERCESSQSRFGLRHYFPYLKPQAHELVVSLFAYPNAPLKEWLNAAAHAKQSVLCLVPKCRILPQIEQVLGYGSLEPLQRYEYGAVTVQLLPFMSQPVYDRLLWHCDLNFVRGEDSFVRAQWAGRPLVWQAYPQSAQTHEDKLAAFMQRYGALADEWWLTVAQFWQCWNRGDTHMPLAWSELLAVLPQWQTQAKQWRYQLAQHTDLATQLVNWVHQRKLSLV